jgi:hypothetical protein
VTEFRYGVIEKALAEVFRVPSDQMSAFRGRLRHLRNINCPAVPKTGSGQPVEFTREHAIEVLIAIELGTLGIAPRFAVDAAKFYAHEISNPTRDTVGRGECLVVSHKPEFAGPVHPPVSEMHVTGSEDAELLTYAGPGMMTSLQLPTPWFINGLFAGPTFAVVNLSVSVGRLDHALRRASGQSGVNLKRRSRSK